MTLSEEFAQPKFPWEVSREPVIRFDLDDGRSVGMPFIKLKYCRWVKEESMAYFEWPEIDIAITGPKAYDFYCMFCAHAATGIKPDGKDILSVSILRSKT